MGAPDNMVFMGIPIGMTGGYFLEINPVPSDALPDMDRKFLLIGQKLSTGTDAVLSPVRVSNAEDAALRYGRGSVLHRMMTYGRWLWMIMPQAQRPRARWCMPAPQPRRAPCRCGWVVII